MMEAEIWGIAEAENGNVVFIKPLASELTVPVFIGQLEVQTILIGFGGVDIPRPLLADLFLSLARELKIRLLRTEIYELKKNSFHARLVFSPRKNKDEMILEARPADALALAVRAKCPIYIAEKVVKKAGIPAGDLTRDSDREIQKERLMAELDDVVAEENYERAAEIRDMLNLLYRAENPRQK